MILRGARVATGPRSAAALDIHMVAGVIQKMKPHAKGSGIDLSGFLCLPGLINAHDHLEFNLFPRLGRGPHPNMSTWARQIYRPLASPVLEHRSVPKRHRLYWGALKNLASGVTTVCHHNPYAPEVFTPRFPVEVARNFGWAHSLDFPPDVRSQWRMPPCAWPFVIHAAESTDGSGEAELARLDALGLLRPNLVIVHGVDLSARQWRLLRERGVSCIACPSSNLFTLGRTLGGGAFRSGVPIALGTDSALTAAGDLLDELRVAKSEWLLSDARLYAMVTSIPAAVLRLSGGEGVLKEGGAADIVAIRDRGLDPASALLEARSVDLVVRRGRVRLASARMAGRLPESVTCKLSPLNISGRGRMLVDAPTRPLIVSTARCLPGPLRLAGKRVRP